MALRRAVGGIFCGKKCLGTFSTDAASQLDVLGHDGHALSVDGAQVGVLEKSYQIGFAGLLQSHDSGALEAEISLEILGDFTYQTLERQLADEELCALLVTADLTESHCTGPVSMGLLHTPGSWGALSCSLGGQLLPGGLPTSGFTGSLLGTCHGDATVKNFERSIAALVMYMNIYTSLICRRIISLVHFHKAPLADWLSVEAPM